MISSRLVAPASLALAFALVAGAGSSLVAQQRPAPNYPTPVQGDFVIKNFHFRTGETMDVKMHYRTIGTLKKNAQGLATNAVLAMHGTGGNGGSLVVPSFAGVLAGAGGLLDGTKYFWIFPDDIGHGASSKPSDGMHMKFPHYGYEDMIEAEYRLLTDGLGVNHARLVMGTSMGAMHTWMWGEEHPDFMDALMPLASVPAQISGRNRAWRRLVIDAITHDPEWKNGEYTTTPQSVRVAEEMLFLVSDNPVRRQASMPTLAKADQVLDAYVANGMKTTDANDLLYAVRASEDYDPAPKLEQIKAPLYAVNTFDDLVNPGEIGILEKEIKRVPNGKAVVIPLSDKTAGHGTHTMANVWKQYLEELLKMSEK
jgi:homoserine O-acetyltransferase/O-succinyltransferase